MHVFKDSKARQWCVEINVSAVKKVKAFCGIDLYGLVNNKFEGLGNLLTDVCTLVDVLFVLCKEQADRDGTSDEEFGRSLGGDSLESATNAFLAELTDFFPDPQRRAAFAKFLEKNRQIVDVMREMGMQELESLDPASVARQLSKLIWEAAGAVGVDPGPFTLRQLILMRDGRSRILWGPASYVLAMIANVNRDRKKRSKPYQPEEFNPHASRKSVNQEPIAQVDMKDLMGMFGDLPVKTVKASEIKVRVQVSG